VEHLNFKLIGRKRGEIWKFYFTLFGIPIERLSNVTSECKVMNV